jgi:hypothetical protein
VYCLAGRFFYLYVLSIKGKTIHFYYLMQAEAAIVKNTVSSAIVIIQETDTSACDLLLEVNLKDLLVQLLWEKSGETVVLADTE